MSRRKCTTCGKIYYKPTTTHCISCTSITLDMKENNEPKQEKAMQKFENKDNVNVKGFTGVCKWISEGLYDGKDVIATVTGKLAHVPKDSIRPVQLICDEAREVICFAQSECKKFKVLVKEQSILNELNTLDRRMLNIHTWPFAGDEKYCYVNDRFPELDLKTGEIVPCEEPEKKIENCCHCYGMSQQLTQEQTKVDELTRLNTDSRKCIVKLQEELKGKDAEVERLNEALEFNRAAIDGYEDITKNILKFKAKLIEDYNTKGEK